MTEESKREPQEPACVWWTRVRCCAVCMVASFPNNPAMPEAPSLPSRHRRASRRRPWHGQAVLLAVLASAFLASTSSMAAAHQLAGSSSGSFKADNAIVVPRKDRCEAINTDARNGKCSFRPKCYECVHTEGCTFDTTTGLCSAVASGDNSTSNATTAPKYCTNNDASCSKCRLPGRSRDCKGSDGCVCPLLCEFLSPLEAKCADEMPKSAIGVKVLAILIGVLVGVVILRLRCISKRDAQSRRLEERRAQRKIALTLSGWRHQRELVQDPVVEHELELHTCVSVGTPDSSHQGENADYVEVLTPKSRGSSSHQHTERASISVVIGPSEQRAFTP